MFFIIATFKFARGMAYSKIRTHKNMAMMREAPRRVFCQVYAMGQS